MTEEVKKWCQGSWPTETKAGLHTCTLERKHQSECVCRCGDTMELRGEPLTDADFHPHGYL